MQDGNRESVPKIIANQVVDCKTVYTNDKHGSDHFDCE